MACRQFTWEGTGGHLREQPKRLQLWKTVHWFPETLKIELPQDPAIPLLGIYPKKIKSGSQRDCLHSFMFTAALFPEAKTWKQPKIIPQMSR